MPFKHVVLSTSQHHKMQVVMLGASRGVGYFTMLNLLQTPTTHLTLILTNPEVLSTDPAVVPHITSGRVKLFQGDATRSEDLDLLFDHYVDAVVVTVGGVPQLTVTGFELENPTISTDVALALVSTLYRLPQVPPPRVVAITSMGTGKSQDVMPLPMRMLYPLILSGPNADKEGLEYLFQRAAAEFPTPTSNLPRKDILSETDRYSAPENFLPEVIIVRPALFTDGEELGVKKISAGEDVAVYTISRKDVARFVSTQCMPGQVGDTWVNRAPVIGY